MTLIYNRSVNKVIYLLILKPIHQLNLLNLHLESNGDAAMMAWGV